MNFEHIKKVHKKLALMAFVQQDDAYVVDTISMETFEDDIKNYCQAVTDYMDDERTPVDQFPHIKETINELLDAYEKFKHDMIALRLPVDEVRRYQRKNTKGDNIKQYERIKKQLTYAMIPMLYQRQNPQDLGPKTLLQEAIIPANKNKKTILNNKNPFSDITIENQAFIFPTDDGNYQTLQFHTGYTLSKVEDETACALVLQPDFKISKTDERDMVENTITMDNTISTKLPDKQGDQELIYI